MKLVVKREPFTAALSAAAAVVPVRGMRPSLKNALLIGDADGNLEVQATHKPRESPAFLCKIGGGFQLVHCPVIFHMPARIR